MIKEDEKATVADLPESCEVEPICTIHVNRETGMVEIYALDLEVMDQEGNIIGTISRAGTPVCSVPLDTFEWTYVNPNCGRFADGAPEVCPECCHDRAGCVCPEPTVHVGGLEEAERIKRARRAKRRAA